MKCRILAALMLFVAALTVQASAAVTSRITPIFYIPVGAKQYDGNQGKALLGYHFEGISRGLGNVANWYSRELPSDNVTWKTLTVFYGRYTALQCLENMVPCVDDVATGLNLNPWSTADLRQKLLIIGAGFLGWAGGTGNTNGQGWAVVGMESLLDLPKCSGNWWCTQDYWHGTVVHELGHTFGLPHSTDTNSIMHFHGDWLNRHLTGAEPTTVQLDPATRVKRANWSPCDVDFQCASKRCGGNVSEPRLVCLPSSTYPKQASNIPDGVFCRNNSECQSGSCGIGPKGERICLRYPIGFFPEK